MPHMSRRKSTPKHTPLLSYELQNIIAGGVLITLAILMVLSTRELGPNEVQPFVGSYMSQFGNTFFGASFRWIFSPILMILGVMILVKRASWSVSRFVGIILFFIASTSLVGWYSDYRSGTLGTSAHTSIGILDIFGLLKMLLGSPTTFIALIVLWFVALYLSLRISYRAIFSKVRESVPSMSRIREAIIPTDDEDLIPTKKEKVEESYKRKADELERKLAAIHKNKTPEKEEKPKSRSMLVEAFGNLTKKIPLETPE